MARRGRISWFAIIFVLLIAAGVIGFVAFQLAAPKIKHMIEINGSAALGGPVTVSAVGVQLWPPAITITALQATGFAGQFSLKVPQATATIYVRTFNPPAIQAVITVERPDIGVKLPFPESPPVAAQPVSPASGGSPVAVSFDLAVNKAQVKIAQEDGPNTNFVNLSDLGVKVSAPGLADPVAFSMSANAGIDRGTLKLNYPVSASGQLQIEQSNHVLKILKSQVDVAGLTVSVTGWTQWVDQKHDWSIITNIPELKNLKAPPQFLPPGQWTGSIISSVKVTRNDKWVVSGNLFVKNLAGQIDMKTPDITAKGAVTAALSSEFSYSGAIKVKSLNANAQLQNLGLTYKDLFQKPAGVQMKFSVDASMAQDALELKLLEFALAQLQGTAKGRVMYQPGQSSEISIKIPKTSLAGFEKILPPLAEMPVQGNMQADVELKGDLNQPMNLTVKISPVLLENVRASVNFKSKDGTVVKGPVSADLRAIVLAEGQNLKSSNITAKADLGGLAIQMGDKLSKPAGSPIHLDLIAQQKGQKISVQKGILTTAAGTLSMTGELQNPQAPNMNLQITVPKLNLGQVSQLVPMLRPMGLSGTADGKFHVVGVYDFKKGYENSPLTVSGELEADLPKFVYKPAKPLPAKELSPTMPAPSPVPLLPNWPVARNLDLKSKVKIGALTYDNLGFDRLSWSGRLNKGQLTGEVSVGQAFGGEVDVTQLELNLAQPAPTTTAAMLFKNVNVGDAFNWAFPTWKDLIKGAASGRMSMKAAHPSRADFIDATIAQGEATLKNGFLSTVKLDQKANELMAKIPGVGAQKLATKGATGDMEIKFIYGKGQAKIKTFSLKTPERNELNSEGEESWVRTDKTMDMKANLVLTGIPTTGPAGEVVAANSDSSGRFVLPVHITGNVFSPEFNLTQETIAKIVKRTAEYKVNRVKGDAEKAAREAAQKEVDKGKQKVQEELGKGIKNLLGK